MKAAAYYSTGAPDILRYEDAGPGMNSYKALIEVKAIIIEGGDVLP
jgi:hypothetical protein